MEPHNIVISETMAAAILAFAGVIVTALTGLIGVVVKTMFSAKSASEHAAAAMIHAKEAAFNAGAVNDSINRTHPGAPKLRDNVDALVKYNKTHKQDHEQLTGWLVKQFAANDHAHSEILQKVELVCRQGSCETKES